jgi:hypothetical protein
VPALVGVDGPSVALGKSGVVGSCVCRCLEGLPVKHERVFWVLIGIQLFCAAGILVCALVLLGRILGWW